MATFPYTPGFVHGETATFAVTVNRFQDWTEQRYRKSRQRGFLLSYEFPYPSSSTVAQVVSFYQSMGGPLTTFQAVDHRDGTLYDVRFAAPNINYITGPIAIKKAMQVTFIVEQGGTTPVATTYTPPVVDDFCDPVIPTSGVVDPTAAEPRDGWPWIGGPATVTPTLRYLPVGGFGGPGLFPEDVDYALPSNVSLTGLTLYVQDIGSAGSVQLACLVNSVRRSELVVTASASNVTVVVTGSIATSATAGTTVCLVSSLGTALATGPTITWGVGYTHPY